MGLDYLALNCQSVHLSGGETTYSPLLPDWLQLVNVLSVSTSFLSVLINAITSVLSTSSERVMRDMGKQVIVVEHDEDMMLLRTGLWTQKLTQGGEVILKESLQTCSRHTLKAQYLNETCHWAPKERREGNGPSNPPVVRVITQHVNVTFPLGEPIVVTGVSGLQEATHHRDLAAYTHNTSTAHWKRPSALLERIDNIDKVVTLTKVLSAVPRSKLQPYRCIPPDIRQPSSIFPAKIRGYKPGRSLLTWKETPDLVA